MVYCTLLGDISEQACIEVYNAICYAETKKEPMILYINSYGGDVTSGTALALRIRNSKVKITTYALADCQSIALLIFASGIKRLASKHTCFMFHSVLAEVSLKKVSHIENSLNDIKRDNARMIRLLSDYTGIADSWFNLKSAAEYDYIFNGFEALKLNMVTSLYDLKVIK
jgi:ATP-dependent protease ClpP protease subunit